MAKTKSKLENLPKKIITGNEPIEDEIIETENLTEEEKITGAQAQTYTSKRVNYESPDIMYKITNLQLNNAPITASGDVIETFIGFKNETARRELRRGAKTVTTKDINGREFYKIEVID